MKSVVLLGKGTLAIRIGEWFRKSSVFELKQVVPVVPEPDWTDSLIAWAKEKRVPYAESGDYRDVEEVRTGSWTVDLALSVFYDRILAEWFIERCGRILNIHNSPLPRYRGVSPINWALKNEEGKHGVTIHEVTPGIDDGPIVAQLEYSIYPELDEVRDVYNRALAYAWTLFEQTMPLLDQIEAQPQDEAQASYYTTRDNDLLGERRGFTRELSRRSAAGDSAGSPPKG
ncbi:MAG: formyltransferase family protein [Gaiellales bacterium]